MMMETLPRGAAGWYAAGAAATLAVCFARTAATAASAEEPPPRQQHPLPSQRRKPPDVQATRQSAGPSWARRRRRRRSKPHMLESRRRYAADHARHEQIARIRTEELPTECTDQSTKSPRREQLTSIQTVGTERPTQDANQTEELLTDRTGQSGESPRREQPMPTQTVDTERPSQDSDHGDSEQHDIVAAGETIASTEEVAECANLSVDTPRTERKKKMQAAFASLNSQMEAEAEVHPIGTRSFDVHVDEVPHEQQLQLQAGETEKDAEAAQRVLQSRAKRNSRGASPARDLRQLMRSRSASLSPNQERGMLIATESETKAPEQIGKPLYCEADAHDSPVIGVKLRAKPSGSKPLSLSRPAAAPDNFQQRRSGQIMAEILQAENLLARFRPSGQVQSQLRQARQLGDRLRSLRHELQVGNSGVSIQHTKMLQERAIKKLREAFVEIRKLLLTAASGPVKVVESAGESHPLVHGTNCPAPLDDIEVTPPQLSPQLGTQFDFLGSTLKAELKGALKASVSHGETQIDGAAAFAHAATNLSPVRTVSYDDGCRSSPQSERPRSPAMRTSPGVVRSFDLDPSSPEDDQSESQATGKMSPPEGLAHGLVLPPVYDSPAMYGHNENSTHMGVSPPALTPPPAWNPAKRQTVYAATCKAMPAADSVSQLDELLKERLGQKIPSPDGTREAICNPELDNGSRTSSAASKSKVHNSATERVPLGEISCNSGDNLGQSSRTPKASQGTQKNYKTGELSACSQSEASAEISVESLREIFGAANVSTGSTTDSSVSDDDGEVASDDQEASSPPGRPMSSPGLHRTAATPVGWKALLTAIENVDPSALRARQRTPPEQRKPLARRDVNPLHDALTATLAKINRVNRSDSESEASSRCSPSISASDKKMGTRRSLRSDWSSSDTSSTAPSPVAVISPGKTRLAV